MQLAKRASTEIVLSFDQLMIRGACCQVVKVSMIVSLLVCSGLSHRTYLLTEKQISKKRISVKIWRLLLGFRDSRFPSGVVEAWSVTIRILIQIWVMLLKNTDSTHTCAK